MQTHPVDKVVGTALLQVCCRFVTAFLRVYFSRKNCYSTTLLGQPIHDKRGELVCTKPFPSMPVCFWNDEGNTKYNNAYFAKYKGELLPCHF